MNPAEQRMQMAIGRGGGMRGACMGGLVAVALLTACATSRTPPVEPVAIREATDAYQAFERGDCETVEASIRASDIESWNPTEVRDSLRLLQGFCQELAGDSDAARETYRQVIREAPLSFASDDARERLRILRLLEIDPDYRAWVAEAQIRALGGSARRAAVDRTPASFPPMAQEAAIGGYAVVEFGVTPRGETDAPVVVDSQPPLLFDGVALRAVREWRYERDPRSTQSQRQVIRLVFQPDAAEAPDAAGEEAEPASSSVQ